MPEATSTATGRSRRHGPGRDEPRPAERFLRAQITPQPATATIPPRPHGDLSRAPVEALVGLAKGTWHGHRDTIRLRGLATREVLTYLSGFDGDTWQQRWDTSPLGRAEIGVGDLRAADNRFLPLGYGLRTLFCLRVVQPALLAFRRAPLPDYVTSFVTAQQDPLLDKFVEHATQHDVPFRHRRKALHDVCSLLTAQGIALADLTPAALLHYAQQMHSVKSILRPGNTKYINQVVGMSAWNVLHRMGHFPPETPPGMRAVLHRGQLSVEQLVDRYRICSRAVRQLLIDYLTRRSLGSDYGALSNLALALAHHFWEKVERLNPDQADLRIPGDLYAAWREMISTRPDGQPRASAPDIVLTVRSFYYDLHTWAADEPERWGPWVAPCPVPPSELRLLSRRRRRVSERTADRTRQRQPLLPILVKHIEERYDRARALLDRAERASIDETFTADGHTYQRVLTAADRHLQRSNGHEVPVRLRDDQGRLTNVEADEESAFWDWACVETLRHSGIRIEELCELTHLSVRQYQRANGETIALLVIAPSKTDRERVIPMSTELFHVIASVIRRHTRNGQSIPLVSRFDNHEKRWSEPLPFLFQRRIGSTRATIGYKTVLKWLARLCAELATQHPAFRTARFTPHDFRRILSATELVNSGLPIHIGATLLGHINVQTTRGYVAVFDEDVVRHYAAFLEQRRQLRPGEEYRPATSEEWDEFEEHLDKRKVELGSCGRPYGTPCQHEHACIRCPMLHINPKMIDRLDELETDLLARRERAEQEQWLGEIEGIDLTLAFLRAKREDTQRRLRRPSIDLGIPTLRTQQLEAT